MLVYLFWLFIEKKSAIKFTMKKIPNRNQKFIEKFFIKKGLKLLVDLSKKKKTLVNQMIIN